MVHAIPRQCGALALACAVLFAPGLAAGNSHAAGKAHAKRANGTWGAVAWSSASGAFGYAVDYGNRRAAEAEAFRQCGSDCNVIRSFHDACGALAQRKARYAWDTGASREIAEMKALRTCGRDACAVAVWACTGAKRK